MTTTTLTSGEASAQSLATGAAGVALLRIEQALTGRGDWRAAHRHIQQAVGGPVDAATHTGLFYGAPAIAFMLHAASADGHPRYHRASRTLDQHVVRLAHRRLAAAEARMRRGEPATFGEYDLFYGLAGIGTLLLHRLPASDATTNILGYLVRLTQPRDDSGLQLPGWWVGHDPDTIVSTAGGHANLGMAHGAAGILAALATATRRGVIVDGQLEAIERLCGWFDRWRQDADDGPWWPDWVTRQELRAGRPAQPGPGRPAWCYGTVGIARALQLAALATGDHARRRAAEQAMAAWLTDRQLGRLTDAGLCHGAAGVYQTAWRAAHDAASPAIEQRLPAIAAALTRHTVGHTSADGLLTGAAGVDLAIETARHKQPPQSGWDTCLLIA